MNNRIKKVRDGDDWEVVLQARDFTSRRMADALLAQARRHVDCSHSTVRHGGRWHYICACCEQAHESMFDAIACSIDDEAPVDRFSARVFATEGDRRDGVRTLRQWLTFEQLVETVYRYPHDFIASGRLTDEQRKYLDKVAALSLAAVREAE